MGGRGREIEGLDREGSGKVAKVCVLISVTRCPAVEDDANYLGRYLNHMIVPTFLTPRSV